MKGFRPTLLTLLTVTLLAVPSASALTVHTAFVGGIPPANSTGAGNLIDVVNAAARIWEAAYMDPVTITIKFGWASIGDAGMHTLVEQGGVPNREITGIILFDNSGAVRFFLDPTPSENEEYRRQAEEFQDLGGGPVNVARLFSGAVGDAAGSVDLFTVAVHEIGHALGMCAANSAFRLAGAQGIIHVATNLPFAGTAIPLAVNKAGITSHIDALQVTYGAVMAGISADERRLPSALDILANAAISGFTMLNLDLRREPLSRTEPSRTLGRLGTTTPPRRTTR